MALMTIQAWGEPLVSTTIHPGPAAGPQGAMPFPERVLLLMVMLVLSTE